MGFNEQLNRRLINVLKVDTDSTVYMGIISVLHQIVHRKKMHTISYTKEDVSADGTLLVRVIASNDKDVHARISFNGENKTRLKSYIGTTYTLDGADYQPFNRQTSSGNTLEAEIQIDPTVDVIGTLRGNDFIGSGAAGARAEGTGQADIETIINAGTELLLEVVNAGAVSSDLGIIVNLYERNKI